MSRVDTARKRVRVLTLRHEVKNLQRSLEDVWENLGTLVLTHRPSNIAVNVEVEELSEVQDQLGQKQATADSLHQARGSRSVLKEVNAEIAALREHQRRLMIAIGQEAQAVKPEMPGALAHYGALERLWPSLETKQRDLQALEQEVGPLWRNGGWQCRTFKRPVILAGAVLITILILVLGWRLLLGGGQRPSERIIGTWQTIGGPQYVVEFDDDGTFYVEEDDIYGTWRILSDGRIRTRLLNGHMEVAELKFEKNEMIFIDEEGKAERFRKLK